MKRQLKQVTLTVAGALASSLLSALLRREQEPPKAAEARPSVAPEPTPSFRSGLVGLISDILAETYRKVQAGQRENRR
ncbi:MAG TPA: hypothetical protein VD886_15995 [Herpetosiphonaceae bacterium]|nr:hypothetical protein [Herpetosiphonaceae bacterium]